jgi:hypothetical protein
MRVFGRLGDCRNRLGPVSPGSNVRYAQTALWLRSCWPRRIEGSYARCGRAHREPGRQDSLAKKANTIRWNWHVFRWNETQNLVRLAAPKCQVPSTLPGVHPRAMAERRPAIPQVRL